MTIPQIPLFTGDIPDRNSQDAVTFTINSIDWLDYQVIQIPGTNDAITEMNLTAIEVNDDAADALVSEANANASAARSDANANFKGLWSTATGAATVPSAYSHNAVTWQLLVDLADITLSEPGVTSDWQLINDINLSNVRFSKIDNPILHLFKKNRIVAVLNGNLSVTRSSNARYVDRSGIVRTAVFDTPREEAEGWLVEGASENLALRSEEFDNGAWTKTGASVVANSTAAPDLTTTADTLIEDTSSGVHRAFQAVAGLVVSNVYTMSCFVKANGRSTFEMKLSSGARATYDIVTGQTSVSLGASNTIIRTLSNGWFRISATFAATLTTEILQIKLNESFSVDSYTGDGVSGGFIWGAQVEQIPFASSYIPTVASTVTRSADTITFDTDENFVADTGSISMAVSYLGGLSGSQVALSANDGTASNRTQLSLTSSPSIAAISTSGSVAQFVLVLVVADPSVTRDQVLTYAPNSANHYVDRVLTGTDVSVIAPVGITDGVIGARDGGLDPMYGHIADLRVYDFVLTLDEIKYLSGT